MHMPPFLQWFWVFVFYGFTVGHVLGFEKSLVCKNGVTLRVKCNSQQEMAIYGEFVKLGCLVLPNGKFQNQCNETAVLKKISIYALDKIVVDRDVIEEGQLQLYIIAPLWEITSFKNISLDGGKGKDDNTVAGNGTPEHPDGETGKSGEPGGHAGNFFGIGKDFLDGNNLVISANGGDGGSGQDGGNGADSVQGSYATTDNDYYSLKKTCDSPIVSQKGEWYTLKNKDGVEEEFEMHFLGKDSGFPANFLISDFSWSRKQGTIAEDYFIYGNPPKAPGNGGSGGQGGNPGNAGNITLYEVCGFGVGSKVIKHRTNGKPSKKPGKGGKGGKCGAGYGYNTVFRRVCEKDSVPGLEGTRPGPSWLDFLGFAINRAYQETFATIRPIRAYSEYRISSEEPICKNGKPGEDNVSVNNTDIVNQPLMGTMNFIASITEYKQYMRANLNSDSRKGFVKCIEESEEIRSLYETIGFLYELQVLENDFYKRGEKEDYSPRYEALLNRIGKYSENKGVQASRQDIKVLSFLYTAISGRIDNIKTELELNIVVDINVYLDELKESLKSLRKDETKYYRLQLIDKYRQKYIGFVDSNIKEAKNLIKDDILPQLNHNMDGLNGEVFKLIEEVEKLRKEMEKNLKEYQEKREKLKKAIQMETIFGVIDLIGKVISIIPGPWAKLAGTVVQQSAAVMEHISVKKPEFPAVQDLKPSVDNFIKKHDALVELDKSSFKLLLDEISRLANKEPENYQHLLTKISNIKKELDDVQYYEDIQHLRDTLKDEIKMLKNHSMNSNYLSLRLFRTKYKNEVITNPEISLKFKQAIATVNKKDKDNSKEKNTNKDQDKDDNKEKVLEAIEKAVQLPSQILGFLDKVKEDNNKLATVDETIRNITENIQKLNKYEHSIKNVLFPMLKNMESDLKNFASSFGTKSVVALDVSSWKVETVLSNVKSMLRKMTEGFETQELLVNAIAKIESTMNILIKVYSTIQNMQREKMTANYIADINSADANAIQIPNDNLRNATEYASILIKSNIIIQQHKILVKSFKHHVFPFAKKFFEGLIIPSTLERGQNIVELVDSAERQILYLRNKLQECQIFIMKDKEYSGIGPFGSLFRKRLKPFFLWKNKEYKNEIAKLLSGEEITILADISKSDFKLFAIKFQMVIFYLKAKTKARQMELNEELNVFNINATHLGYSYYRYNNQTYLITSEAINIWHSFMRHENSKIPLHMGGAYDTLLNKNPPVYLLSPYTLWKLQIKKSEMFDEGSFDTLLTFKDEVDIELAGNGFYILPEIIKAKDYEVDKYYQPLV